MTTFHKQYTHSQGKGKGQFGSLHLPNSRQDFHSFTYTYEIHIDKSLLGFDTKEINIKSN